MSTRESRIVLGAYDDESIHPTGNNWTRHSRFKIDCYLKNKTEIAIPHTITYWTDIDKFVIDRSGNILMTISDSHLLNSHFGKVIKIDQGGNISELYATNNRLLPPVIGKDQKIYVAEAYSFKNDDLHLYCLDSQGILLWKKQFSCNAISSIPVLDQYGNIYIVTEKELEKFGPVKFTLLTLTSHGDEKWNWVHEGKNIGEPKIGKDGSIYYSTINDIIKFSLEGHIEWEKSFNTFIGPLNINVDGNICFEAEGYLYVLNEKGDIIHKIEINRLAKGFLPLELTDDIFLCEVNRCKLIALDASKNEILWEYQSKGFQVDIYPIIDSANHIIFSATGYEPKSYINIMSKDGEGLWEYEIDGSVLSVVLGADNLLHILCQVPVKKSKNKDALPIGCKIITLRS